MELVDWARDESELDEADVANGLWVNGEFLSFSCICEASWVEEMFDESNREVVVWGVESGGVTALPTRKNCPPKSNRFMDAMASCADWAVSYSINP